MSNEEEIKFSDKKSEYTTLINSTIQKYLDGKKYNKEEAKKWVSHMTEEIIKTLQSESNNFKIVCLGGIMEKGRISLHISSSRLIDPSTDDCITVKYENEEMNCFITLIGLLNYFK
jgi:predicted metal-dependent RNase